MRGSQRAMGLSPSLRKYQAQRSANTAVLVETAIAYLRKNQRPISLAAIREAAAIVPNGRSLSESTLLRNPKAYELYSKAAGGRNRPRVATAKWIVGALPEDQWQEAIAAVNKLRRMSKTQLVMLAWSRGQYVANLEAQLKLLRSAALDANVPHGVKILRPVGRR